MYLLADLMIGMIYFVLSEKKSNNRITKGRFWVSFDICNKHDEVFGKRLTVSSESLEELLTRIFHAVGKPPVASL